MYSTMNVLVLEVLGGLDGNVFSKCILDFFLAGIPGVIVCRLFEYHAYQHLERGGPSYSRLKSLDGELV